MIFKILKKTQMGLSKFDKKVTEIDLSYKNITTMNWKGCPPGLTKIFLGGNKIKSIDWKGCPVGLTYINLGNNKITHLNWEGCPPGLTSIDLYCNNIKTMNWKGCPAGLTKISLDCNKIKSINWEGCPPGFAEIILCANKITSMNWEGCPPCLTKINLAINNIKTMNWKGCPSGLTIIDLHGNNITYLNWEGCRNEFIVDFGDDEYLNEYIKYKKVRDVKPVEVEDRCKALKKDGNPCCNRKKVGDLCGRHVKKPVSEEIVNSSDFECQSCEVKTSIKVDLENGSSVPACESCIEAGAIENVDYDSL